MNKPLQGITVIAASLAEAGPVTSEMLGMLGAEVWHIERPTNGPTARYTGSLIRMANKKSITLDTKTEEGKAILWRLIERPTSSWRTSLRAPGTAWASRTRRWQSASRI